MPQDSPEASTDRFDRFVENLPGVAYRSAPDPPWEMEYFEGRVESLTGYPPAAFEDGTITFSDLVVDADLTDLERTVAAGVDDGRQFSASYRIQTASGARKHVLERGVPVDDAGGVALEGIIVDVTQRKAYELRLKRQNDLFARTQRMASVGGWEYDPDSDSVRWTDEVYRIHGVSLEYDPSVEEAIEFYHPDDRATIRSAIETAIEEGVAFDEELRIEPDGCDRRWVHVTGESQCSDDGEARVVRGAIQDVTERRQREQTLREERALTRSIFEGLPDLLYAFDENLTFERWNDEARRVSGYSDAELDEMGPFDIIAEADHDRLERHLAKVFHYGDSTTVEARLETSDGRRIPYELTGAPLQTDDDEFEGVVGVGRDVSDRKQRQRRFEAAFNNTYQFTGLLNTDGELMEVNDAGLTFADTDRDRVIGSALWDVLEFSTDEDEAAVRRGFEQALDGEFFRTELSVDGSDGEAIVDFSIRPITNEDGEVTLLVPEGRDVTTLKNRERLLQVLHRLLRHNTRNDLTAIRGYTHSLADELDGDLVEYADRIDDAAADLLTTSETAKQMVDTILERPGTTAVVDVRTVVDDVVEQMAEQYPDASIETGGDEEAEAECDRRVRTVLEQLVENAIEHNPSSDPRVEVRVIDGEETVAVQIEDDGPGISEEEWSMIDVEIHEETDQLRHGSGIGLLLARWTVDEFGGDLHYDDEGIDGDGTTVTVVLPSAE